MGLSQGDVLCRWQPYRGVVLELRRGPDSGRPGSPVGWGRRHLRAPTSRALAGGPHNGDTSSRGSGFPGPGGGVSRLWGRAGGARDRGRRRPGGTVVRRSRTDRCKRGAPGGLSAPVFICSSHGGGRGGASFCWRRRVPPGCVSLGDHGVAPPRSSSELRDPRERRRRRWRGGGSSLPPPAPPRF